MNILLIGSGGREHVIAHRLSQSKHCSKLFISPGNPGTFQCGENISIPVEHINELVKFAKENVIELTFVGPEIPLALGIVDAFKDAGLRIVGPDKNAAQLESSKAWAKSKYKKYNIPSANFAEFHNYVDALEYVQTKNEFPIVIKADGLAAV